MAIKKQKRSLEEAVSDQQNGAQNKKSQDKNKKIKIDKRPTPQDSEASPIKKAKKNVATDGSKNIAETKTVEQNMEGKAAKKAAKLLKKNENRKEARKEHGQFKPENVTLSKEEINKRIAVIQARKELTKSAKRKLGVLRKKLSIIEGTFVSNPKPVYATPELAKKARRDRRKERIAQKKALLAGAEGTATDAAPKAKVLGKTREGVVPPGKQAKDAGKKKKGEAKKIVIQKAESEESEDDEEEEEEEEEEDSDEEMDDSEENLNEAEEQSEEEEEDDDEEDDEEEDEEDDDEDDEEEEEEEEETKPPSPKKKVAKVTGKDSMAKKEPAKASPQKQQVSNGDGPPKKYVLFVRNIPFDSSPDDIKKHFLTKVSGVVGVRIPNKPGTTMSRGLAFVEFSNEVDYQKGLSLHNTMVNGRRINVEYTQGGSKSVGMRPEVVGKNKNLHAMRKGGGMQGGKRNDRQKKQKST